MFVRIAPVLAALLFVACSDTPSGPLHEATAMVLQSPEHGPELCLGFIALPNPPICGGVPLQRWDWGAVDGEEETDGTIWGEYHVTGTYDGETLTVTDVGPSQEHAPRAEDDPFDTPCPEPEGGWPPITRKNAYRDVPGRVTDAAESEPDFAALWIDYYDDNRGVILNVAFTGDLARHERELKKMWPAVCVTKRDVTHRELEAIQEDLTKRAESDFGLDVLWSSVSELESTVEIGVVAIDDATRAELDDRYDGLVEAEARLTPVE